MLIKMKLFFTDRFKIWDYFGDLKFSYKMEDRNELWQVQWQPGFYPTKPVYKKNAAPVVKEESRRNFCLKWD
jgi:hypothetical protein